MQFDVHTHSIDKSSFRILNSGLEIHDLRFFSSGIHPWKAKNFNVAKLKRLEEISSHKNCLAIGEIGLDKLKGPALQIQIEVFKQQVLIAEEMNLPVIIHCVKAWNELREVKRQLQPTSPWIFHGFSKVSILKEVIDEGLIISLGQQILNNSKLQFAINDLPLNRLLLETDDSSIRISQVYEQVSKLKKINLSDLEKTIEENTFNIFPKWKIGLRERNY